MAEITGWRRLLNEPALISGFVNTLMVALIAFGFSLSEGQTVAVMGLVNAALAIFVRVFSVPTQLVVARTEAGLPPIPPTNNL